MNDDDAMEPGPAFDEQPLETTDAERHPEAPANLPKPEVLGKRVTVDELKTLLRPAFGMADELNGGRVIYADLQATDDELHDICAALCPIVNRSNALRQMAEKGEGLALAMALGRYGVRVGGDHMDSKRALQIEAAEQTYQQEDPA